MPLKEFGDRYGPTMALLVVLALLVVVMPGNVKQGQAVDDVSATGGDLAPAEVADDTGVTADTGTTAATDGTGAVTGSTGSGRIGSDGVSLAGGARRSQAAAAKGISFGGSGPQCRPDGRQKSIAITAPACANGWVPGSDNGGATARGVTKDKILVVRFVEQVDQAQQAALAGAGASDTEATTSRMYQVLAKYYNQHYETYGREVVIQDYQASGPSDNEEAMRSDAVRIANELKAFAVLNGPDVLAEELSQRGVVQVGSPASPLSKDFFARNTNVYGVWPTANEYYQHVAEYWAKKLVGKNAQWAGDAAYQNQPRKFGLIWREGTKSRAIADYRKSKEFFVRELKERYNITLAAEASYSYDLARAGEVSTGLITKMKSAGVTTLMFVGESLTPIFLTKEATRQAYFPEWFIFGASLMDTTFFGRTYDPAQWSHAFGISPIPVLWANVENSPGFREYHHGKPGSPKGEEGVAINTVVTRPRIFFSGIQLAGPNLTAATFRQGLLSTTPFGGLPTVPKIYYTAASPNAVKDFTEVWWDPNGVARDEVGKDGRGRLMRSDGGKRYDLGRWLTSPSAFNASTAAFTTDQGATSGHDDDGHTHPANQRCLSCGSAG
ncbi:MAG TPA: hypothetical protein VM030_00150 [Acidimicrobiales bacterium]|nr:hypothetical protein [Acidimicrobiales bacterium]